MHPLEAEVLVAVVVAVEKVFVIPAATWTVQKRLIDQEMLIQDSVMFDKAIDRIIKAITVKTGKIIKIIIVKTGKIIKTRTRMKDVIIQKDGNMTAMNMPKTIITEGGTVIMDMATAVQL
jgi:hypothetical protein